MDLKRKVIITGSTGMVGEGVLYQCLNSPEITAVLVINRKSCGYQHPKLKEIIHQNFLDLSTIESELSDYNACFFCLGISSVGISDEAYYKTTYSLTIHIAETLSRLNNQMTFCYVSGSGTDSKEKSRLHWARVKGKTENDLMKLPFAQVFNFRPGFIRPIKGLKFTNKYYKYINWLYPIGRAIYPAGFCTLKEIGNAMINTLNHQNERKILEGKDIIALAKELK
jgi:uncharacterized protein YbjT (DUF2867 family)